MSKYTTQVRYICEKYAGLTESAGYDDVDTIISNARSSIFDFTYPFFTDDTTILINHPEFTGYKEKLECKILSHYYLREIGCETVGIFKLWLKNMMREIMPYYNQMYLSTLLEYDPLTDVNVKDDSATTTDGVSYTKHESNSDSVSDNKVDRIDTSDSTANSTLNSNNVSNTSSSSAGASTSTDDLDYVSKFLDTPQSQVNSIDNGYLTNIKKDTTDDTNTTTTSDQADSSTSDKANTTTADASSTTANTLENGVTTTTANLSDINDNRYGSDVDNRNHRYGKGGSTDYADLIQKYRNTFLNIDMLIIDELDDLFMKLW